MRESVFGALGDLAGLSFLDMFSGSGIIALEAASRGAASIEAVESDPLKRKTLLQNAAISPVRINCRFMPVELYVKRAKRSFDIIFLDPPFPYQFKWKLLEDIASSPLVSGKSILLMHYPREDYQVSPPVLLTRRETREYGRSAVDFFSIVNYSAKS
jgi:16S rRNA (guanine(966)-N(2))-methyltransferase RsmD